uniref:Uncharacterized protein n=1 Tax=Cannabis sativa TaxID=3483 RepID=A0A803PT64_CANSA
MDLDLENMFKSPPTVDKKSKKRAAEVGSQLFSMHSTNEWHNFLTLGSSDCKFLTTALRILQKGVTSSCIRPLSYPFPLIIGRLSRLKFLRLSFARPGTTGTLKPKSGMTLRLRSLMQKKRLKSNVWPTKRKSKSLMILSSLSKLSMRKSLKRWRLKPRKGLTASSGEQFIRPGRPILRWTSAFWVKESTLCFPYARKQGEKNWARMKRSKWNKKIRPMLLQRRLAF